VSSAVTIIIETKTIYEFSSGETVSTYRTIVVPATHVSVAGAISASEVLPPSVVLPSGLAIVSIS
jgi:hypothetical protein